MPRRGRGRPRHNVGRASPPVRLPKTAWKNVQTGATAERSNSWANLFSRCAATTPRPLGLTVVPRRKCPSSRDRFAVIGKFLSPLVVVERTPGLQRWLERGILSPARRTAHLPERIAIKCHLLRAKGARRKAPRPGRRRKRPATLA